MILIADRNDDPAMSIVSEIVLLWPECMSATGVLCPSPRPSWNWRRKWSLFGTTTHALLTSRRLPMRDSSASKALPLTGVALDW